MKKTLIIMLLTLVISLLLFTSVKNNASVSALTFDDTYTGVRDSIGNWVFTGYESIYDESYYSKAKGIETKNELISVLHSIISSGTKTLGYSSCNKYLCEADQDPNNHSKCICLYTGVSYPDGSGWNKEHVWAKAHGFSSGNSPAYSDIHHLHVTENNVNSARGNSDFFEVDHSNKSYGSSNNNGYDDRSYYTSSKFEPRDSVKGDVARSMFYMVVRYTDIPLTLVNGTTSAGSTKFGDLATLIKWHEEDPVDDFERRRNDVVQCYQGNRNPFIDHPEYANIIFGSNYEEDNKEKEIKVTFNVGTASFDYTDSTVYTSGSLVKAPTSEPVKSGYQFEGWYTNSTYTTKWNFATDKITKAMTLYAKFSKVVDAKSYFSSLTFQQALSFDYKKTVTGGTGETVDGTLSVIPTAGPGSYDKPKDNTTGIIDISEYFSNTDLFKYEWHYNGKTNAFFKSGELRLYNANGNGSELVITAKDKDTTFKSCDLSLTGITVTISSDKKSISIKNTNSGTSGNIKIQTAFNVDYESGDQGTATYEVSNLYNRYQYSFNNAIYYSLLNYSQDLKLGFTVNGEFVEGNFIEENGTYCVTMNLVPTSYADIYEIEATVIIAGETIKGIKAESCSVYIYSLYEAKSSVSGDALKALQSVMQIPMD